MIFPRSLYDLKGLLSFYHWLTHWLKNSVCVCVLYTFWTNNISGNRYGYLFQMHLKVTIRSMSLGVLKLGDRSSADVVQIRLKLLFIYLYYLLFFLRICSTCEAICLNGLMPSFIIFIFFLYLIIYTPFAFLLFSCV